VAPLTPPGPSFIPEEAIALGGRSLLAGIDRPTVIEGWWLVILWVADADRVVECADMAPGILPSEPPLAHLGPRFSGGLFGFVLEEDGRQQLRLRLPVPADDPAQAWSAPLVVQVALRWEPARAAVMTEVSRAETVLTAFRHAVEAVHRP
jgi:hypothetical protein